MNKLEMLHQFYEEHGDFRICRIENGHATKWQNYSTAPLWLKDTCNLRELLVDEILLDCESLEQGNNLIKEMISLEFSFSAWSTGSRGIHIHLFFMQMQYEPWTPESIKKAREWFIRLYKTDPSKKAGVVALENAPHFKTGRLKTLICDVDNGINILPPSCVSYAFEKMAPSKPHNHNIAKLKCRLIRFSLYNALKSGTGRGDILMRNAAVYFLNTCGEASARVNFDALIKSQKTGSSTWLDWALENKKSDFSCAELRKWLRDTDQKKN